MPENLGDLEAVAILVVLEQNEPKLFLIVLGPALVDSCIREGTQKVKYLLELSAKVFF